MYDKMTILEFSLVNTISLSHNGGCNSPGTESTNKERPISVMDHPDLAPFGCAGSGYGIPSAPFGRPPFVRSGWRSLVE